MNTRVLSPAMAERAAQLAKRGLPPQPIRELMDDIAGDIRVAKLRKAIVGQVGPDLAVEIDFKKLRLEEMYRDWIEGKTVSFPNQE